MEKFQTQQAFAVQAGKALIVSYSYSGNTYRIAQGIQAVTGGDLCEIFPWQPYPMSFPELLSQVKREIHTKQKPRLLETMVSPKHYDLIFAGSPNWCGTIAPPLYAWLSRNDFSGKVILPFGSHCGGVKGDMQQDVAKLCPKAEVRQALCLVGDGGPQLEEQVSRWLAEQGVALPFKTRIG